VAGVPSPISFALPLHVKRRTHLRDPVGETIRYRLPPSLYLPGLAVATFRAVSLPAITSLPPVPKSVPKLSTVLGGREWSATNGDSKKCLIL